MNVSLSPLFLSQLKNLHKVIVRDFKASILARLKGEGYDFAEVVKTTRAKAEGDFRKEADGESTSDGQDALLRADSLGSYDIRNQASRHGLVLRGALLAAAGGYYRHRGHMPC